MQTFSVADLLEIAKCILLMPFKIISDSWQIVKFLFQFSLSRNFFLPFLIDILNLFLTLLIVLMLPIVNLLDLVLHIDFFGFKLCNFFFVPSPQHGVIQIVVTVVADPILLIIHETQLSFLVGARLADCSGALFTMIILVF